MNPLEAGPEVKAAIGIPVMVMICGRARGVSVRYDGGVIPTE